MGYFLSWNACEVAGKSMWRFILKSIYKLVMDKFALSLLCSRTYIIVDSDLIQVNMACIIRSQTTGHLQCKLLCMQDVDIRIGTPRQYWQWWQKFQAKNCISMSL